MKPLAVALSGVMRALWGGSLRLLRIVTMNTPLQRIYPNKNGKNIFNYLNAS
jgi:hypothetical protein